MHGSSGDSARQRVGAEDGGSPAVWPQEGQARVLDTSRNFLSSIANRTNDGSDMEPGAGREREG